MRARPELQPAFRWQSDRRTPTKLKLGADVPLVVCSSEKGTGIDELRSLIKNSVR